MLKCHFEGLGPPGFYFFSQTPFIFNLEQLSTKTFANFFWHTVPDMTDW